MDERDVPKWQSMIWLGLGVGFVVLLAALLILVTVTQLFTLDVIGKGYKDRAFITTTLTSSNLILLRLIVVLIGGGISLAGLAVSFFAHEHAIDVAGGANSPTAPVPPFRLRTHSPGVLAILVGAVIIVAALFRQTSGDYVAGLADGTNISEHYEDAELRQPEVQ